MLADARDWEGLRGLFAETVALDNTSLRGGNAATVSSDEVVAGWRQALQGLDVTQHLIANHQVEVDGDDATCIAYFQAVHRLATSHGDPLFTVGERYDFRLHRAGADAPWRIGGLVATSLWTTGNQPIMQLAAEKARAE